MLKKNLKKISLITIFLIFILSAVFICPHDKTYVVQDVITPKEIVLNGQKIILSDYDSFDSEFTEHNKTLASKLNISEVDAFIIGNLGKYWTSNLLKGRHVYIKENGDLIYLKYNYTDKFKYSGFCIKDSKPCYKEGFENVLYDAKNSSYKVLDLDNDKVYEPANPEVKTLKNFIVVKKIHLPRHINKKKTAILNPLKPNTNLDTEFIKIYFSDSTTVLKPDRNCSASICREILTNINNSKETIDMAVYGYSRTPQIEKALKSALKRGVKIRLVYDSGQNGGNIYPDTKVLTELIKNSRSDINSPEVKNIMHNKFYIFDNRILITGSANLSHTDMSGFNSNSIVVIKSPEAAKIYADEFNRMYNGAFHNDKISAGVKKLTLGESEIQIYFSPQDKAVKNAVIPLINNAQKYIYIPTFVLTERNAVDALIKAKQRGVDVRIIIDALNASVQHSKHKELRGGGILVKTENYAGKMHSKSMIVDDKYTIIGSMNFSNSGENRNDENLIVINNEKIAKFYKNFFLYQWSKIDDKWLKQNARAEGKDSIGSCSDGIDNNYDGLTDNADPACQN